MPAFRLLLPALLLSSGMAPPLSAGESPGIDAVVRMLSVVDDADVQRDLVVGLQRGLAGRRKVKAPPQWPAAYHRLRQSGNENVRASAVQLALIFDDQDAIAALRRTAADRSAAARQRVAAIQLLAESRQPDLDDMLLEFVDDVDVQQAAIRGLASYRNDATAQVLLKHYQQLNAEARQDALLTLAARGPWARELLQAVERGQIERREVSAYVVRQLRSLEDPGLDKMMNESWGSVRATSAERRRTIQQRKRQLSDSLELAVPAQGKKLFERVCGNCHRLFGEGENVGPDLTGAQRNNLDYLLENVIDPNATVSKDFQMEVFSTVQGRIITGLVVEETGLTLTVQTYNQKMTLPKSDIDRRRGSELSLMPEGLLEALSDEEIRDLFGYLGR